MAVKPPRERERLGDLRSAAMRDARRARERDVMRVVFAALGRNS